jgi:hypothetical protein
MTRDKHTTDTDEIIRELDVKISETQKLADEAQRWANQLGTLKNNLDVLKRARELLLENEDTAQSGKYVPVIRFEPTNFDHPADVENPSSLLSIGATAEKLLRDAGVSLSIQDLRELMKQNGRDVPLKTLAGVISQYVSKGRIKRTGRGTYRAAIIHTGGRLVGEQP